MGGGTGQGAHPLGERDGEGRQGWGAGGHSLGRPELTIEEAGLGSGVAFGVAIPSPAQLLAVEEVPKPGAGVQAVPAGRDVRAQPRPRVSMPSVTPCVSATPPPLVLTICLAQCSGQDAK